MIRTEDQPMSRLSARAVTAGFVGTVAIMVLLMSFVAGLGVWQFRMSDIELLGNGFWVWSFLAWIGSVYVGSYVAAIASGSTTSRDGYLHGFTVWASSCFFFCAFLSMASYRMFDFAERMSTSGFLWIFTGNLVALAVALIAGRRGARKEAEQEDSSRPEVFISVASGAE